MAQIHMTYWNNKIPEFRPRLECQICPLYTDERRKKWISDLQRVCEFKTRKQSYRCLTAIDYAAFTFMVTDAYKLEMLCKILGYFQIVDDHSDDRNTITQRNHEKVVELWKESQMVLKKLLNPGFNEKKIFVSMHKWRPYNSQFYAVCENIMVNFNSEQRRRFISRLDFYFQGNIEEDINVTCNDKDNFDLEKLKIVKCSYSIFLN